VQPRKRGGALIIPNRPQSLAERGGRLAACGVKRPFKRLDVSEATVLGNEGERELGAGQQAACFFELAAHNRAPRCQAGRSLEPPDEYGLWHPLRFFHEPLHAQALARVLSNVTQGGGDGGVIGDCVQLLKASITAYRKLSM